MWLTHLICLCKAKGAELTLHGHDHGSVFRGKQGRAAFFVISISIMVCQSAVKHWNNFCMLSSEEAEIS